MTTGFFTLPGLPSDVLTTQTVNERELKVADTGTIQSIENAKDFSGAFKTIELEHHKIHNAQAFQFIADLPYTSGQVRRRLFKTGDCPLHFKEVRIVSEKPDFVVELFENPTVTDTGTLQTDAIIPYNRTILPEICGMEVYTDPVIEADGLRIDKYYLPGGEGPGQSTVGSEQSAEWEFVLRPFTFYLLRGEWANGSGTNRTIVKYKWYIQGARQTPLDPWENE